MNCYSDKLRVCVICNADESFNFREVVFLGQTIVIFSS